MNVSVHGRVHSTHVLSVEFLELVKRHLKPGGIHFFNTTYSPESLRSGVTTFRYGLRIFSFLAVSDSPIQLDAGLFERRLRQFAIDARLVFDRGLPEHELALQKLGSIVGTADAPDAAKNPYSLEFGESLRRRLANYDVITDDNMGSEWK